MDTHKIVENVEECSRLCRATRDCGGFSYFTRATRGQSIGHDCIRKKKIKNEYVLLKAQIFEYAISGTATGKPEDCFPQQDTDKTGILKEIQ